MLKDIAEYLRKKVELLSSEDKLIYNNKILAVDRNNFSMISGEVKQKTIAFIDGGQAEILSAGNFCLSFIRIGALVFRDNKKTKDYKHEFYLLTTARYERGTLLYESKIFGDRIIDENDLLISSEDSSIRIGMERAPISRVSSMARRFAELSLAKKVEAEVVVLDGTMETTFRNEEKYLNLPENVCSIAKSSSLFTTSGNSPTVLLNQISPEGCWSYLVEGNSYFVKLHPGSKHVFRFMGDKEYLSLLSENSKDALFLGYPYGLIAVDKFARVSNSEKNTMRMNLLLRDENKKLADYLSTSDAHQILDNIY